MTRRPLALFTAGAPGAGKSMVIERLDLPLVSLDPDRILDEIAGSASGAERRARLDDAFALLERRQAVLIAGGISLVVNTTAADLAFVRDLRTQLTAAGYLCAMIYVDAPLGQALDRNSRRLHPVPPETVRAKHARILANLAQLERLFTPRWWRLINDSTEHALAEQMIQVRMAVEGLLSLSPSRAR
jgi:predicted kinase